MGHALICDYSNLDVAYEKCRPRAPRVVSVYPWTDEQIACAIFWWIPFQIIQLITHDTLWIGISCCWSMGTQWWPEVVRFKQTSYTPPPPTNTHHPRPRPRGGVFHSGAQQKWRDVWIYNISFYGNIFAHQSHKYHVLPYRFQNSIAPKF